MTTEAELFRGYRASMIAEDSPVGARAVAQLLGCSYNTVMRLSPDDLPFWRLNPRGDRRYALRDVYEYRRRRAATPGRLHAWASPQEDSTK